MAITIRKATKHDLGELQQLFVNTIYHVCGSDYTDEQLRVWALGAKNTNRWYTLLKEQWLLVAELDNCLVGFASLKDFNYIDLLYVHHHYLRQGIAESLVKLLEQRAINKNQHNLKSDVSVTARPFFEKMGFVVLEQQTVRRESVELVNFKMMKHLKLATQISKNEYY